jgi:hypothetical protein
MIKVLASEQAIVLLCKVDLVFRSALVQIAGRSCQVKLCIAFDVTLSQALEVPQIKS